jgi:ADP-ribose 1''-phosphate phosphatase
MGKVTTIKGSLFDAPKGSIIIHACNTKGVWGSGIAAAFAKMFPYARSEYATICRERGASLIGTCLLIPTMERGGYIVGCLFTSKNYGRHVDTPDKILKATKTAIDDLIKQNIEKRPMHMCKINSGLFRVPWGDTKKILKDSGVEFTVYDY